MSSARRLNLSRDFAGDTIVVYLGFDDWLASLLPIVSALLGSQVTKRRFQDC